MAGYYGTIQLPEGTANQETRRAVESVRKAFDRLEVLGRWVEVHVPIMTDSDVETGDTMLPELPVYLARLPLELVSAYFTRDIAYTPPSHTLTLAKRDGRGGAATTIGTVKHTTADATAWVAFLPKAFVLTTDARTIATGAVVTLTITKLTAAAAKIARGVLTLQFREAV